MRKKIKIILFFVCLLGLISSVAFAGVLMSQWTDGNSRFCKYSDGQVIKIDFNSMCPSYNE
jgi:hypothetical protein